MREITNPILPGFNPDPSIVRVDNDYYIATSTFEWFPGVRIYHSRDLVHWRLIARPLNRKSQLDMIGNPPSCGIWAPCLSYRDGLFYLIYTDVKSFDSNYNDTHNYLVTAPDVTGPWSEPVYLNSSGFDPSMFHDDDGKKWLVNMLYDHRKGKNPFAGIVLQEYCPRKKRLVGQIKNIFKGTELGCTEGAHIYKWKDYYYLVCAEGGTGFEHAVTVARSKTIDGPYEVDPDNPILTSKGKPNLELQKAGHASIVQTQNDEWYMVHLCARPLSSSTEPLLRCILGRETAIQKCYWTEDNWLRVQGGNYPAVTVSAPELPEHPFTNQPDRDDFGSETLSLEFSTLRVPPDESWLSLKERPGFLRLKGRESLNSKHRQSLVAKPVKSFTCQFTTCVEFNPQCFQHMAGLVAFYDNQNYFYLRISHDEQIGKCLGIITSDNGVYDEPLERGVAINDGTKCFLRAVLHHNKLKFYYSLDGHSFTLIGQDFDATILSDEYCKQGWFTGTFVGLCCQDLSSQKIYADFDFFEVTEL